MWYRHMDKHTDPRNELNPHVYGRLISDEGVRTIQWENSLFQQTELGQLESHGQMKEAEHIPHTKYIKVTLKWVSNLNIRAKAIHFLEENIRINLHNLGLGDNLPGVQATDMRL